MGSNSSPERSLWKRLKSSFLSNTVLLPPSGGQNQPTETSTDSHPSPSSQRLDVTSQQIAWLLRERAISHLEDTGDIPSAIKLVEKDPFLGPLDQQRVRQILTEHADNFFALDTFEELALAMGKPPRELLRAVRQQTHERDALASSLNDEPEVAETEKGTSVSASRDPRSDVAASNDWISPSFGVWPTETNIVWAGSGEKIGNWERLLELIEGSGITNPDRTLETIKQMLVTNRVELASSRRYGHKVKSEPHSPRAGRYEGMWEMQIGGKRRIIWKLERDRDTQMEVFSVEVGDKDKFGFHKRSDKTRSL